MYIFRELIKYSLRFSISNRTPINEKKHYIETKREKLDPKNLFFLFYTMIWIFVCLRKINVSLCLNIDRFDTWKQVFLESVKIIFMTLPMKEKNPVNRMVHYCWSQLDATFFPNSTQMRQLRIEFDSKHKSR